MREFETGANRNSEEGKIDYEGFLNPLVIKRFGEYMDSHRQLETGELRDSDNWQKGIPLDSAMKSAWRHFHDWHMEHRGYESREGLEAALCGLLFNVQSYLLTILEEKQGGHWTPVYTQEQFNDALDASPYDRDDTLADVPGSGAFSDAQQQDLEFDRLYDDANGNKEEPAEEPKNWVEAWPKWFQNVVGAVGKGK